jgi:hypothetical protein
MQRVINKSVSEDLDLMDPGLKNGKARFDRCHAEPRAAIFGLIDIAFGIACISSRDIRKSRGGLTLST